MTHMLGVAAARPKVDFVKVGREHALAAWQRALSTCAIEGGHPLELVPCEANRELFASLYGQVDVMHWSAYRDAYRSELHCLNLSYERGRKASGFPVRGGA